MMMMVTTMRRMVLAYRELEKDLVVARLQDGLRERVAAPCTPRTPAAAVSPAPTLLFSRPLPTVLLAL